jgi:1-deoxy-D-xylulose-5-phosphate reductoisomerase
MNRLRLTILGSTGSIGRQAIDVASRYPDRVEVVALAASTSVERFAEQARVTGAPYLVLADPEAAARAASLIGRPVHAGPEAVAALAGDGGADIVLNALVGAAGLRASASALASGARLALANKESLVVGGELVTSLGLDRIVPVDSEHSAIYQSLLGEPAECVSRLWLTASGGPFRGRRPGELADVTVEEALAHPRWTMGPKITIDSATLMNKGLEVIEAHHLFGVDYDRIKVVVHPQSCVHSMVEYVDGSVKAHLGVTDMRIPIQYALSAPDRWVSPVEPVDFATLGRLDFEEPDFDTFPCLGLALEAGRIGGTMPAALNAANEVAVAAFLGGSIPLTAIPSTIEQVLGAHEVHVPGSIEEVEAVDEWARREARRILGIGEVA